MQTSEQLKNPPEVCYYDVFTRATLGRYLPECLQEVVEVRPADPIEYIANWLYKAYDSDMYYKTKVIYLREIHELGEIMKREKQEHEDKIKPFIQAMQAERWNYFASLHAELEALEETMAQVDTEVDDGTKLRFLEVQLLIKEERDFVQQEYLTPLGGSRESLKPVEEESDRAKPNSSFPASVRSSSHAIEERKSAVMFEVPAADDTEDSRRARRRLSPIARLGRGPRRPSNQIELSCAEIISTEPTTQAADMIRKHDFEDGTFDQDSVRPLLSILSRDGKKGKHGGSSQASTASFIRSESGSVFVDSTRSDEDNVDSVTDQQGMSSIYKRKQAINAKFATMTHSDIEDCEIQSWEIDGKSRGGSLSASPRVSLYSPAEGSRLPGIISQGKHSKEKVIRFSPWDREKDFAKTSHLARYGLPRQEIQSPHETTGLDHQVHVSEVPGDAHITRIHTKDDCGGFHLPPVGTQRGRGGVAFAYEDGRLSEEQERDITRRSESPDQVVRLPAILTDKQKTGTLVMTNSGHVAFVSKELGVLAPNSLRIRNVHPIDKPEMWARRNFQPQSFYDHELYSETDHAMVEGENDERWYSYAFRMALDDTTERPYRKWKKPKDDESY